MLFNIATYIQLPYGCQLGCNIQIFPDYSGRRNSIYHSYYMYTCTFKCTCIVCIHICTYASMYIKVFIECDTIRAAHAKNNIILVILVISMSHTITENSYTLLMNMPHILLITLVLMLHSIAKKNSYVSYIHKYVHDTL